MSDSVLQPIHATEAPILSLPPEIWALIFEKLCEPHTLSDVSREAKSTIAALLCTHRRVPRTEAERYLYSAVRFKLKFGVHKSTGSAVAFESFKRAVEDRPYRASFVKDLALHIWGIREHQAAFAEDVVRFLSNSVGDSEDGAKFKFDLRALRITVGFVDPFLDAAKKTNADGCEPERVRACSKLETLAVSFRQPYTSDWVSERTVQRVCAAFSDTMRTLLLEGLDNLSLGLVDHGPLHSGVYQNLVKLQMSIVRDAGAYGTKSLFNFWPHAWLHLNAACFERLEDLELDESKNPFPVDEEDTVWQEEIWSLAGNGHNPQWAFRCPELRIIRWIPPHTHQLLGSMAPDGAVTRSLRTYAKQSFKHFPKLESFGHTDLRAMSERPSEWVVHTREMVNSHAQYDGDLWDGKCPRWRG